MCTFIMAWRVFEGEPVVVAANRDERLDRPSSPPGVFADDPRVVAPRDDEAGGTWIGYNEHGVLACITNRWTETPLAAERSRGLLVGDALGYRTAADAARAVAASTDSHEYDGFNLVVVDADDAVILEWDGDLVRTALQPGLHIVVNVGYDDELSVPAFEDDRRVEAARRQRERTSRAYAELQPDEENVDAWLDRAVDALTDSDYGFLVRGDGFGTRSSSIIRLRDDGTASFAYADGPPDETPFEPVPVADHR